MHTHAGGREGRRSVSVNSRRSSRAQDNYAPGSPSPTSTDASPSFSGAASALFAPPFAAPPPLFTAYALVTHAAPPVREKDGPPPQVVRACRWCRAPALSARRTERDMMLVAVCLCVGRVRLSRVRSARYMPSVPKVCAVLRWNKCARVTVMWSLSHTFTCQIRSGKRKRTLNIVGPCWSVLASSSFFPSSHHQQRSASPPPPGPALPPPPPPQLLATREHALRCLHCTSDM